MNITLSVAPEIVKEVREYAAKHGTGGGDRVFPFAP